MTTSLDLADWPDEQMGVRLRAYDDSSERDQVEHLAAWANVLAQHPRHALVKVLNGCSLGRYLWAIGVAFDEKDDGYTPAVWRQDHGVEYITGPGRPAGLTQLLALGWEPFVEPTEIGRRWKRRADNDAAVALRAKFTPDELRRMDELAEEALSRALKCKRRHVDD